MSKDKILREKLAGLYSRRNAGIKFGLDVQEALMRELGDPQASYAVVHVAGTNGKGSVCAMIAEVLRQAGLRVGLYVSPHLVEFNERMSVDGENVTDEELLDLSELVDAKVASVESECGRQPTFFEYSTALAMKFFERKAVQVAVLETGMGGRLDATNVVTPLVSVITRIGVEHAEFLGKDIAEIAGEKAGIIKAGRPVVCGAMPEEAARVIRRKADDLGCICRDVEKTVALTAVEISLDGQKNQVSTEEQDYGRVTMGLIGAHQAENCATVVAAFEEIQRAMGLRFDAASLKRGLKAVEWPARFQVVSRQPPVILDGAHNPMAAESLVKALKKVLGPKKLGLVVGMCGDKDVSSFISAFRGTTRAWAVTIRNERAVPADDLARIAASCGIDCKAVELGEGLAEAKKWASETDAAVCVTGSLFLAGEATELIAGDE
jgi:dihydrofolate synthase/folylpolyglutamate synthase